MAQPTPPPARARRPLLFGLLFVMPQYLQDVGGLDPLGTGVRLLPMIGGMIVATRVGPMLVKGAGSRFVIIAGLALSAAALGLAATTEADTGYAFAALWITLLGAGIGLVLPASVGAAIGALSAERAGSGSGLMQALRQVGATIGVAGRPLGAMSLLCHGRGHIVRTGGFGNQFATGQQKCLPARCVERLEGTETP